MISRCRRAPFLVSYQEFSIAVCRTADWRPTEEELRGASHFGPSDVTGSKALFVADPFLAHDGGTWHLFFEMMPWGTRRGVIGVAHSPNLKNWHFDGVALEEPFHLSFPHVFRWSDAWFMIPETSECEEVRLYRSYSFPFDWRLQTRLLKGRFSDTVVWEWQGTWFMLSSPRMETVRLFTAPEPSGPWLEHAASPIVDGDLQSARPAGPIIAAGDDLYRLAQDCRGSYGLAINGFRIEELTPERYEEGHLGSTPILSAGKEAWRRGGMHHLHTQAHPEGGFVCACDGWRLRRRLASLGI